MSVFTTFFAAGSERGVEHGDEQLTYAVAQIEVSITLSTHASRAFSCDGASIAGRTAPAAAGSKKQNGDKPSGKISECHIKQFFYIRGAALLYFIDLPWRDSMRSIRISSSFPSER